MLYQNDGFGKDYLIGLKDALGVRSGMIVKEASYETSEPTVNSEIERYVMFMLRAWFNRITGGVAKARRLRPMTNRRVTG